MMLNFSIFLSLFNIFIIMPLFIYVHNKYFKKILSIPMMLFLMLLLVYPLRSLFILLDPYHNIIPGVNDYSQEIFSYLLIYANISIFLFFLSFYLLASKKILQVNILYDVNLSVLYKKTHLFNFVLFIVIFYFSLEMASQMSQYGQVQKSIMGGINIYYSLLFSFKSYILVYFAFFYFNYGIGKKFFFLIIFLTVLSSLISGSKSGLVFDLILLLLIYKNGSLKLKYSYMIIGFLLLILTSIFANIIRFGNIILKDASLIEKITFVYNNMGVDFFYSALNTLTSRFHGIDSLFNLFLYTENSDLFWGGTLKNFFIAFYPRIFWQDKPDIAMGIWFGHNVFQRQDVTVAFWLPGEAFLNFGYAGVLLVFLYGLFVTFLDKKFHNNNNIFVLMIYISMFFTIKTQEYTIAAALSGLIKNLIPVIVFIFLQIFIYKLKIR